MSINNILLGKTLDGYTDLLYNYGCSRPATEQFLLDSVPFLERQQRAIDIVEGVLAAHGKEKLLRYLAELARVEHGIRELEPWVRDHVVHAVLSYILGAFINERFLMLSERVDFFQWKIAGLLHDVGYPVEIAANILQPFEDTINGIKNDLGVTANEIKFLVLPENLENLTNGVCSFDLIQQRLEEWRLQIDVRSAYERMLKSGKICHGMISSLALLYVLDLMYQKYNPDRRYVDTYLQDSNINWNQKYFEGDIVSACSAVYIHNLDSSYFSHAKIERSIAPTAFLLKLSDSFQDWERPSLSDPNGIPADKYYIEVANGDLILHCDIPSMRKENIRDEVFSCLEANDIMIL